MQIHELCSLFPKLDGESYESLKADINANGQRNPIMLHEGMILDGQNRYRACTELGIKPLFESYLGDDILDFVLAQNLHRRHLSAGQSATIVALAQDWELAHPVGKKSKSLINQEDTKDAKLRIKGLPLDKQSDRAEKSGASKRTQFTADKLAKENPDLAKQVASGEISLNKAIKQIEPEKVKEDDAFDGLNISELYESEVKENKRLHQLIDALTADDKDKELTRLSENIKALEGRLKQSISTESEAVKQAKYYGKLLASIRSVIGVEQNQDILVRIKSLK